ncbi:hypothetical protein KIN20_013157 [Parelaphostrongylus tenuis]|uniref:Reverse transcriptase domain-containing protein n=1 Tax=Parelaphostrongylus tenuis TaxID=148309 RepID=A0AAD5QKV6_PARTN|nr:hypothetical protein KIN20_013157 [Parelaphostrongylus tenuis]
MDDRRNHDHGRCDSTAEVASFYNEITIDGRTGRMAGRSISPKYTATLSCEKLCEYCNGTIEDLQINGRQSQHLCFADGIIFTASDINKVKRTSTNFDNACEKIGF